MFLKLAPMIFSLCAYSSATNHHPETIIKDFLHLGHHYGKETEVIRDPLLPPPLAHPKLPTITVKDPLNYKLPGHHHYEEESELPKPIMPLPLFPEVPIAQPPIFLPKPIIPPILKQLPKLPLPPPPFLKKQPFPVPIGHHKAIFPLVVKEPIVPVVKPLIPIIKHHHVIPIHEHI